VNVSDGSEVAEARRAAAGIAQRHGFSEEAAGRTALVATELATNLVKHGRGGRLLATPFEDGDGVIGIELVAIDKGTGIADIGSAMVDGVSTSGTPGNGLGAVVRQSDLVDVYSRPGAGTAILARLRPERPERRVRSADPRPCLSGAVCVPYPGEQVSGDAWQVREDSDGLTLMVADGLGHGPLAAQAADQAVRLFETHWRSTPADALQAMHDELRATRGAAIAIARIDRSQGIVLFAGVGNVVGTLVSAARSRRMLSHNGTVGHSVRRFQTFDYPLEDPRTDTVVMHSDGLSGSWSMSTYPGLLAAHPSVIASVLYRDFARGRDDAAVLVARTGPR
jgi:anti-sigma regulatory factor (Ser/Thr protein kinase)